MFKHAPMVHFNSPVYRSNGHWSSLVLSKKSGQAMAWPAPPPHSYAYALGPTFKRKTPVAHSVYASNIAVNVLLWCTMPFLRWQVKHFTGLQRSRTGTCPIWKYSWIISSNSSKSLFARKDLSGENQCSFLGAMIIIGKMLNNHSLFCGEICIILFNFPTFL